MANTNADPFPGRVIGENGEVVNLVGLLGGSSPVPGMARSPSQYDPVCIRLVAEDGTVHNLVDLLRSGGGGAVEELPEAGADTLGKIYQYAGETTAGLTHGYFYECVENDSAYSWSPLDFGGTPVAAFSGETLVIT